MKQIPNIYRIDKQHYQLRELDTVEAVIEKMINLQFQNLGYKRRFLITDTKHTQLDDIRYFLYLYNSNEIVSDWKEFLPSELTADQNFTQQKLSLIIFIDTERDLFVVVGGGAFQVVLPYLDQSFGLNTYARIMQPETDELASIKSRGITGARAGMNEQFRDNYKIIDFIKFGKVPQEINVRLSPQITDLHFQYLKAKRNDRINVTVGKGFKIKKDIDFPLLHTIINELVIISELIPSDYLSSYKEINDRDFIDNTLQPILVKSIWDDSSLLRKSERYAANRFQFDFCNPNNIDKFYEADCYKLKEKSENGGYVVFKEVIDRDDIYDEVISTATEKFGNDFFKFRAYLQGIRVCSMKQGIQTVASGFLFHFSTEFMVEGKPTFLIDTKWYHLRDSFIKDLKISTQHVLTSYAAPLSILPLKWDKETLRTEGEYNLLYRNMPNYLVADTVIVQNIELCDIIHYDDSNLYLIHVKYGFTSRLRELENQIKISARRLKDTLGTEDMAFLEELYNKLVAKQYITGFTIDEFKLLFRKKIYYVLAFTSHLQEDLKVKDCIDRFNSNIARFSLIQCSSEMRADYYDLLTFQIPR